MSDPTYTARMDQALAEARDDCQTLVRHLAARPGDPSQATADFVQGLLDRPEWDRLMLATVLGAAVARLVELKDADYRGAKEDR